MCTRIATAPAYLTPANGSDVIFRKVSCLIFDFSKQSFQKFEQNRITSGCGCQICGSFGNPDVYMYMHVIKLQECEVKQGGGV